MEATAPPGPGPLARRAYADLLATARRDRVLYAIALVSLAAGFLMQPVTGNRPDWAIVRALGGRLLLIGVVTAVALVACRLVWLGVVARSRSPSRDLARWAADFLRAEGLASNVLHTLGVFFLFAAGFSVLKGAVAVIAPFAWDPELAELDRILHFGRYPHEWLQPLLNRPLAVFGVNLAYNLWYLVVVLAILVAAGATRSQALRQQYLMSFMLVWFVGGFLVAIGFSSAGPCYYARVGLGDTYAPLMAQLEAADAIVGIWALSTQDALWEGFSGVRAGSAGISAFPSMHVATATLFVLAARRMHRWLFAASIAFWALVMLGSVLLAWHYAVDGYGAALLAVLAWRLGGRCIRITLAAEQEPVAAAT